MSFDLPLLDPFGLTSVLVSEVVSRITIYTCYIQHSYFQQLPLTSHIHKQQCQKDPFYSSSLPPTRPLTVK